MLCKSVQQASQIDWESQRCPSNGGNEAEIFIIGSLGGNLEF